MHDPGLICPSSADELFCTLDSLWTANHNLFYRGEPERYESCLAPLDRILNSHPPLTLKRRLDLEIELMLRFHERAVGRLPAHELAQFRDWPGERPFPSLAGQMIMRHWGVPTRLLDWSRSPFVALYFAVSQGHADGRVMFFSQKRVRSVCEQRFHHETTAWNRRVPASPDPRPALLDPECAEAMHEWIHWPADEWKDLTSGRMRAQSGVFTFASKPGVDHWACVKGLLQGAVAEGRDLYREVVVPSSMKIECLTILQEKYQIGAHWLFPEAEGAVLDCKELLFRRIMHVD